MILIPEFFSKIAPYLTGTHPVQQAFLHHLFSGSVDFPFDQAAQAIRGDDVSYQKVALLGYWSLFDERYLERFAFAFGKFKCRKLDHESFIMNDIGALMGIALGLRKSGSEEGKRWWENQLARWSQVGSYKRGLRFFLDSLAKAQVPDDSGEFPEAMYIYLLIQGGRREKTHSELIKEFYVKTRKQAFPGPASDFHLTMLGVYCLDECFRRCIWEEDQVRSIERVALEKVSRQMERVSHRQGRWIALAIYLTGIPGIALCSLLFFGLLGQNPAWNNNWELLKQGLLFLGGPLPALYLIANVVWTLAGRHPPSLEFGPLSRSIASFLARRRHRRWGVPPT